MDERLTMVTYDIADQKRWRFVFKVMKGYGEWVQLSVFQCRLSPKRRAESVTPRVTSLGKEFSAISREAVVI